MEKENLKRFFKEIAKTIDPKIKEVLDLFVDKKTRVPLNYQIETGGKRLRPGLAVLSCLACGGKKEDVIYPAAGLEILHNCTLLYDDIIDNSYLRRGKPTTWAKFGKSITLCLGMDYAAAAFQGANRAKDPVKTSEVFAQAFKVIMDGEILDILFEQSGRQEEKYILQNRYKEVNSSDYLKMIKEKTAVLMQACCEVGAIAASAKKSEVSALRNYGLNIGIAFQIKDDILDIFGKEKKFGKKIGHDIHERKLGNIVIGQALKELPKIKKDKVLKILRQDKITDKEVRGVVKLLDRTKAKDKSLVLGRKYVKIAKDSLKVLPKSKWRELLADLADFIIERES